MVIDSVHRKGGTPVYTSLRPEHPKKTSHDWKLDFTKLRQSITKKTKLIILNNPHNPVGKVFSREELQKIADIATEFDLIVVADEVYENLVYSDSISPMIKFGTLFK
jgi:aspartate/methionine/tyrosine aminotransferase